MYLMLCKLLVEKLTIGSAMRHSSRLLSRNTMCGSWELCQQCFTISSLKRQCRGNFTSINCAIATMWTSKLICVINIHKINWSNRYYCCLWIIRIKCSFWERRSTFWLQHEVASSADTKYLHILFWEHVETHRHRSILKNFYFRT